MLFLGVTWAVSVGASVLPVQGLRLSWGGFLVGVGLGLVLTVGIVQLVDRPWVWLDSLPRESRREMAAFAGLHPLAMACVAVSAGVIASRGSAAWLSGSAGHFGGLLIASSLFGLMHPTSRTFVLQSGCFGLIFAVVSWCQGGLWVAVVAHTV